MNEPPKQRWGCLQWGIVAGVLVLLALVGLSLQSKVGIVENQMRGVRDCQQIIMALKSFSKDNSSMYPDAETTGGVSRTANQVFRRLFQEEILSDERIFGCPSSRLVPDGDIGAKPRFEQAVASGECHWMLLKHQTDHVHPRTPLIIENSLNADWPPKWDVSRPGIRNRGQAWPGRKIIIGRNDGSVALEKLREDGTMDWHSPSNLDEHGKSWIDYLTPEEIAKLSYWDIEEK